MKRTAALSGIAVALAMTTVALLAQGRQAKTVVFASSSATKFTEVLPGVSSHLLWGDTASGPAGSFTKFTAGFDAGMHTHTNDVWLVVFSGAYLYRDEAGDKRVGPGDFIRIRGGHRHWSGGDPREGAVFYQESFAKFDLVPAQ